MLVGFIIIIIWLLLLLYDAYDGYDIIVVLLAVDENTFRGYTESIHGGTLLCQMLL